MSISSSALQRGTEREASEGTSERPSWLLLGAHQEVTKKQHTERAKLGEAVEKVVKNYN